MSKTPISYLSCCACLHEGLAADFGVKSPEPCDEMKIFTALLGLCAAASVVSAIEDSQDVEKRRQFGAVSTALGHEIESAVDCAGCQVRSCTSPT